MYTRRKLTEDLEVILLLLRFPLSPVVPQKGQFGL